MFSRNKLVAALVAVPALIAGVLVALPVEAASHSGVQLLTSTVIVGGENGSGNRAGRVKLGCNYKSTTCKGTMRFEENPGTYPRPTFAYSVKPGQTASFTIYYWNSQHPDPTIANPIHKKIEFNQSVGTDYAKWVYIEPRVSSVRLTGTVTGPHLNDTSRIRNIEVGIYDWNGRSTREIKTVDVTPVNTTTGTYAIGSFPIGANNTPSPMRRMRISAQVKDYTTGLWIPTNWWWRGSTTGNGGAYGGSRYINDANGVRFTKYNEDGFKADFNYGKITGHVTSPSDKHIGADIRISAPPVKMPSGSDLRELDIPYCANDFATTKTNGSGYYEKNFLPANVNTDKRYLVKVSSTNSSTGMRLWNGQYRSCLHTRNYVNSNANLEAIPGSGTRTLNMDTALARPANIESSTGRLDGDLDFSGFTPKKQDLRVTLREYHPYKKILDSPIVGGVYANVNGSYHLLNVPPGRYWIEAGRRTGCSGWYPSLYTDNYLYHQGADRGAERWKTVNGKYPEYQKSYDMGYVAKTPPSGYRGWMYRGFCESRGAGTIIDTTVTAAHAFDGVDHVNKDATLRRGATVSGHISRGSKSNKEMLVSIYSTVGTLVMRTAYSGKSGNFKVQGLASGNYNIMVNADSWRGIGRTFTGRHTIRVTAGNNYNVGTLSAKF